MANPVDLDTVTRISRFRSCAGHDYSPGFGQKKQGLPVTQEIARSMKHYIDISNPLDQPDSVKGYAPFAGTVRIYPESEPLGQQVWIDYGNGWALRFFHGDPLVKNGAKVTAGQQVVAWPPKDAFAFYGGGVDPSGKVKQMEFDVSFEYSGKSAATMISILTKMTPQVAALWAAKGFTPATAILTKAYRDAHPCEVGPDGERFTDASMALPDNFVQTAT